MTQMVRTRRRRLMAQHISSVSLCLSRVPGETPRKHLHGFFVTVSVVHKDSFYFLFFIGHF